MMMDLFIHLKPGMILHILRYWHWTSSILLFWESTALWWLTNQYSWQALVYGMFNTVLFDHKLCLLLTRLRTGILLKDLVVSRKTVFLSRGHGDITRVRACRCAVSSSRKMILSPPNRTFSKTECHLFSLGFLQSCPFCHISFPECECVNVPLDAVMLTWPNPIHSLAGKNRRIWNPSIHLNTSCTSIFKLGF